MEDYKKVIEREGKDPIFYLPILRLFEKKKTPLSIKEVENSLNISYDSAKQRLHKLKKYKLLIRMKRGYYRLALDKSKYSHLSKPSGKLVFINGCIRIMGSSNGVGITVYNSRFGEFSKDKYCNMQYIKPDRLILRKTNKFAGSKIHFLISKSVGISISRRLLPEIIVSKLSSKVIPIKVGIYLDEWGLSIKEIFSTESKEEGELAVELEKLGEIDKKNKFEDLKADILFTKDGLTIPIEITNTSPFTDKGKQNSRKSGVKSALIYERLYFFIKWNLIYNSPTVLILNTYWKDFEWLKREKEFMKKFSGKIIFTDFKPGWEKEASQEINRLMDESLFNKTTQLGSNSSSKR